MKHCNLKPRDLVKGTSFPVTFEPGTIFEIVEGKDGNPIFSGCYVLVWCPKVNSYGKEVRLRGIDKDQSCHLYHQTKIDHCLFKPLQHGQCWVKIDDDLNKQAEVW